MHCADHPQTSHFLSMNNPVDGHEQCHVLQQGRHETTPIHVISRCEFVNLMLIRALCGIKKTQFPYTNFIMEERQRWDFQKIHTLIGLILMNLRQIYMPFYGFLLNQYSLYW